MCCWLDSSRDGHVGGARQHCTFGVRLASAETRRQRLPGPLVHRESKATNLQVNQSHNSFECCQHQKINEQEFSFYNWNVSGSKFLSAAVHFWLTCAGGCRLLTERMKRWPMRFWQVPNEWWPVGSCSCQHTDTTRRSGSRHSFANSWRQSIAACCSCSGATFGGLFENASFSVSVGANIDRQCDTVAGSHHFPPKSPLLVHQSQPRSGHYSNAPVPSFDFLISFAAFNFLSVFVRRSVGRAALIKTTESCVQDLIL